LTLLISNGGYSIFVGFGGMSKNYLKMKSGMVRLATNYNRCWLIICLVICLITHFVFLEYYFHYFYSIQKIVFVCLIYLMILLLNVFICLPKLYAVIPVTYCRDTDYRRFTNLLKLLLSTTKDNIAYI